MWASCAFGVGLQDLARSGQPPVVLLDCLRFLAVRGLNTPALFASPVDKRRLLALKEAYDAGHRAVRGSKAAKLDPRSVANLLLLWLGALPEPLFPPEFVPELLRTRGGRAERVAAVRGFLKRTEPFIVEALFPLFELLHHYWINQPARESTLHDLGMLFSLPVFGVREEHGVCGPEAAALLAATTSMMVEDYRPLFTQPYNLQRYEADLARQAAAAEAVAQAAAAKQAPNPPTLAPLRCWHLDGDSVCDSGSPLITPRRLCNLSVMVPDAAASPEPDSPAWPRHCSGAAAASHFDADVEAMLDSFMQSTVSAAFEPAASCASSLDACALDRLWSPTGVLDMALDAGSSDGSESCTSHDSDSEAQPTQECAPLQARAGTAPALRA